jgi:UDP-N-acetylmuramate--alanine ligase
MVVEADESDGTFIRLPTEIGVVTNIDPEHLDYYGSEEKLHEAFRAFFSGIPQHGAIIAGVDHPVVARMIAEARLAGGAAITTFGESAAADIRVRPVAVRGGTITMDVEIGARAGGPRRLSGVTLQVPGRHNTLNAAAAIGAALRAGIPDDAIMRALRSFTGVDRRFTQTGDWNGVSIYDDYAHHPAEIEAVLSAARGAASGNVIAVMQPHRFSRLKMLFDEFCGCFADADFVLVAPVYPAGEAPNGVDSSTLVEGIRRKGHERVFAIEGEDTLAPTIASLAKPGDLVIGLGAGNITDWARALPARLQACNPLLGAAE